MPQIRIERTPIKNYGLGLFGADHLLLTYVPDGDASDARQQNWYVIEGLKSGGVPGRGHILGVEGVDGHTTLSEANGGLTGSALVAQIGTPGTRKSTVIDFPQGAFEAWQTMASYADDIDSQFLPYQFYANPAQPIPSSNSSSVIASLLFYAGIDLASVSPIPNFRYTSGATTLLGTSDRDEMFISEHFKNLLGGKGSDIMHGSDGSDRMNGGEDADFTFWSPGFDHIHGGQYNLEYKADGVDVVGYYGAGVVHVGYVKGWIAHKMPTYIASYASGKDYLYSIERLEWNEITDELILGEGIVGIYDDIMFDLKGDGGGNGDKASFLDSEDGLLLNASAGDIMVAQATAATNGKGWYVQSAEWIEGSAFADRIYANSSLRVIDGGGGDDFIDARLDAAFGGGGPSGYDIELIGGEGNDTILSGEGRTLASGGAGEDRFVFTTVNTGAGTPEFVIADVEQGDRLFVAYNFFNGSGGGFEGSQLMPLLGTLFPFELLQDPDGPGELNFEWQQMSDILGGNSQVPGLIDFIGRISYALDGSDLIISLYQGNTLEVNLAEDGLPPDYFTVIATDPEVKATIRVVDFQPGDLGIEFHDTGDPQPTPDGDYYPGWDTAVATILNDGEMLDPFDPRPTAPTYDPTGGGGGEETQVSGTQGDDVITVSTASSVDAGAGHDTVTGSAAADRIDGGSGDDTLAGGLGDDTYIVDGAGDIVVEVAGEGVDTVFALVSHALADNVEVLELGGEAAAGTGNGLDNRLIGNDLDNVLDGAMGDDTLAGGLGNDTLVGGGGDDIYVYFAGEGDDIVIDAGAVTDVDTLSFGIGIAAADITFHRPAAAPDDLVLSIAGGGRVVIRDYAAPAGGGVEVVTFFDGTAWTRADLLAAGTAAPVLGNDPPQAVDDDVLMVSSPTGLLPAAALLANDRDPGGDPITVVAVFNAEGGTVTIDAGGDIRIDTAPGYDGLVGFDYTISDGAGGTATARATVTIIPNLDPVAIGTVPDYASPEDAAVDITLPAGIFGDGDGDPLAVSLTLASGDPLPAWLDFDHIAGRLTGTPPRDFHGPLALRVEASDGLAVAAHAFTLSITPVNDAPVALPDAGFAATAGTALVIPAAALLANDTDVDGDALSVTAVGGATGGTVAIGAGGAIVFTPAAGFSGAASFTYTVADGAGGSHTASVSVTVTAPAGQTYNGTGGNDSFTGTLGNDVFTLVGDGGLDTIDGGGGTDTLRGSAYNDIVRLAGSPSNLTSVEIIDGGAGNDRILGGAGNDVIDASPFTLLSIELIDGGAGDDIVIGSGGDDTIAGNTGNDLLYGGLGDDAFNVIGDGGFDRIDGGAGFDTIRGSVYNDNIRITGLQATVTGVEVIDGGAGNDRILGSSGADLIDLTGITLVSVEGIDGGAGDDAIIGSAGHDIITGNVGNDWLAGGLGDDVFMLAGDGGLDTIDGGAGFDTIRGSVYNDIVRISTQQSGITGIERIEGGDGYDRILGGSGGDTIDLSGIDLLSVELVDGGQGDDLIVSGISDDVLAGGAGSDTFVFRPAAGHDRITDFTTHRANPAAGDLIDLTAFGYADFAAVLADAVQDGADTVIALDTGVSLRLTGISLAALGADDVVI